MPRAVRGRPLKIDQGGPSQTKQPRRTNGRRCGEQLRGCIYRGVDVQAPVPPPTTSPVHDLDPSWPLCGTCQWHRAFGLDEGSKQSHLPDVAWLGGEIGERRARASATLLTLEVTHIDEKWHHARKNVRFPSTGCRHRCQNGECRCSSLVPQKDQPGRSNNHPARGTCHDLSFQPQLLGSGLGIPWRTSHSGRQSRRAACSIKPNPFRQSATYVSTNSI
ncbi:hypothetical protein EJ04DRAFT_507176 [Polyplosphaeria fusca]|uniref:Uncharacterized protein n=1 Tax=Polyplosphaeria fusca TaxID=682080 RepID=A0A9P4RD62_9PLEO|nr:hypothetical protein EJ04DRAFT_507176 [Polyplosphaeria fusca]